jgi:hypothetical protein
LRAAAPISSPSPPPRGNSKSLWTPASNPPLEAGAPPSVVQQENAEAQLAEADGIYGDFTFVVAQPFDPFGIREPLGRLAEDVGVDQISRNVSVDSDPTGTKKPFPGQASSQSTTPSFGASERRLSRYSPRSRRSMSNSWPALSRSCCRISAGRTIWPFDDMVVFMGCKIASYIAVKKHRLKPPARPVDPASNGRPPADRGLYCAAAAVRVSRKAGITSLAKRSRSASWTSSGVPSGVAQMTRSRPG